MVGLSQSAPAVGPYHFSWREQLPALCWATTGEGGTREGFAHCPQQAALLRVTPWQPRSENRCVVWYKEHFPGKWESWVQGQRSLESTIFLASTQPNDCCVVWDGAGLFLLFWIQQVCINQCKIWEAWDKQRGLWPCGTCIRSLWDI